MLSAKSLRGQRLSKAKRWKPSERWWWSTIKIRSGRKSEHICSYTPALKHQNWFLPSEWGLALWSSLSFSVAQLNLKGHTTGTWVPTTKLSSHPHSSPSSPTLTLQLPPALLRTTLLPTGAWKRVQIRVLSPLQSFLHTHHSIFLIIPLLQIFLTTYIGSSTNTITTCDYCNFVSQPTLLSPSKILFAIVGFG